MKFPALKASSSSSSSSKTYISLGLSLPLTVSAWSSFKKKSPDTRTIKLHNMKDTELQEILLAADEMYVTGELQFNDAIYERLAQHKNKLEPEMLWRLARSTFEKAKKLQDQEVRKNLILEAYGLVKKSLEYDEHNFAAHKWAAILLNEKSKLEGLKSQITQSFNVKFHMQRAVELSKGTDPTSSYLLGVWCFSVSEVPWIQQKLASAIFATPPTSTYEEALTHFIAAENMQPLFYSMNLLMLAKTYKKLGDDVNALFYLNKLQSLPLNNEEDVQARKEGDQLKKTLLVPDKQEKSSD